MIACVFEPIYSRQNRPSSTRRKVMKRDKSNYHALHVLRTAELKLRKAIISKCNKELANSISESTLNVLKGNIKLKGCNMRKL